MHPLDGPRLKVVRAREHLQSLQNHEARFFLDSNPYSISDELDAQMGKHLYRVTVLKNPPARRFAALIGDCAHNLRSALDHLAWRLSADFSGPNDGDTMTQFPIFRFEKGKSGFDPRGVNQIARVGPGAAAVIRLLQPFHDDQPLVHPLWFVRELDNGDKHRQLAVSAAAASYYTHRIQHAKKDSGVFNLILSQEDVQDGAVIAELTISPPEAKVSVEAHFVFRAVLTAPTVPITSRRLFAHSFLEFLAGRVDGVINCFEPFYTSGSYDDAVVLPADPIRPFHEAAPYDPQESSRLTDEEHTEWAKRARDGLLYFADEALSELESKVGEPAPATEPIRSMLVKSNLASFRFGVNMALERVENREGDLELPTGGSASTSEE
jgi:hypothetical protein